jgi:hypothetical protein
MKKRPARTNTVAANIHHDAGRQAYIPAMIPEEYARAAQSRG